MCPTLVHAHKLLLLGLLPCKGGPSSPAHGPGAHVTNNAHFYGLKMGMSRTTPIFYGTEMGMSQTAPIFDGTQIGMSRNVSIVYMNTHVLYQIVVIIRILPPNLI